MKKRLIMAVLAVLLTMVSATAQFYEDWNTGYSGLAFVYYEGSSKRGLSLEAVRDRILNDMREGGTRVGNCIGKLTKENLWLIEKGIREQYDCSVGDIFCIIILKKNFSGNGVFPPTNVFVEITATGSRGHFSYSYYAYPTLD